MKKYLIILFSFIFLLIAKPTLAVQFKNGTDLNFPKEEKIDETVLVSGNNLTFSSPVTGDIICAGRNIVINSDVKGDIICVGQNIKITGVIDGNIRVLGQSIDIEGTVLRNVSFAGQDLTLGPKSNVKGDIMFGSQTIDLSGVGGRDLVGAGNKVTISGSLLRNAVVTVSSLDVSGSAKVGGSLDYFVEEEASTTQTMVNQKNIKGDIRRHVIATPQRPKENVEEKIKKVEPMFMVLRTIFGILSFTLLSFLLLYFSPRKTNHIIGLINRKPVISGLVGLATLVVAPIALMIICSTIIGLPVAFVLMMVYIVTLMLSSLYASNWIGRLMIVKLHPKSDSLYLAAFIGCLIVGLISSIPVLGWLVVLVLFLMGLGASFLSYLPETRTSNPK